MKSYTIMMAVRLIEMKRILKDTGSIYLHCDPTASHYLKLTMDAVFGKANFRNEIAWHYGGPSKAVSNFPKKHDAILLYSKSSVWTFNPQFGPLPEYMVQRARKDADGRLWVDQNLGNISSEKEAELDRRGYTFITKAGKKRRKQYLDEMQGRKIDDVWPIPIINSQSKERIGYPTQKPLELLERIIKASSNAGDLVLDPFCGCATACVAAERLGRQWAGINLSAKAAELVKTRIEQDNPLLFRSIRSYTGRTYRSGRIRGSCRIIGRISIVCSGSRRVAAAVASSRFRSGTSPSITSCRAARAAPTTTRTCSCCARRVTRSRGTGRRHICCLGWNRPGNERLRAAVTRSGRGRRLIPLHSDALHPALPLQDSIWPFPDALASPQMPPLQSPSSLPLRNLFRLFHPPCFLPLQFHVRHMQLGFLIPHSCLCKPYFRFQHAKFALVYITHQSSFLRFLNTYWVNNLMVYWVNDPMASSALKPGAVCGSMSASTTSSMETASMRLSSRLF